MVTMDQLKRVVSLETRVDVRRWRGKAKTQLAAYLVGVAYKLHRIAKLAASPM